MARFHGSTGLDLVLLPSLSQLRFPDRGSADDAHIHFPECSRLPSHSRPSLELSGTDFQLQKPCRARLPWPGSLGVQSVQISWPEISPSLEVTPWDFVIIRRNEPALRWHLSSQGGADSPPSQGETEPPWISAVVFSHWDGLLANMTWRRIISY